MTPELVFSIANPVALVAWVALFVRPHHPQVQRLSGQVVPAVLAATYSIIVVTRMGRVAGDFNSLAGVAALFRDPWILLAGWVHYLAFDLLVGAWEVRDAATRKLPHWRVIPCLVLTFLVGPLGWLLYLAVRKLPLRAQGHAVPRS